MEYRGTDFLERRRMVLEPQMKKLRSRCERLYNYHSYCLFDKTYKKYCKECDLDVECVDSVNDDCEIAEKFCTFLEGTVWDGDKVLMLL